LADFARAAGDELTEWAFGAIMLVRRMFIRRGDAHQPPRFVSVLFVIGKVVLLSNRILG